MSRTALVTGGTRGIGLAISAGLKAAGYQVAANYGGNDAAAQACEAETGAKCYKFDVSDFEAV
ncbi:MAG: SDR family NAD(P)-dependent oxidoreductase, partial [Pseudomonadota bacterium]